MSNPCKHLSILLITIVFSHLMIAQEIKGRVVDIETQRPLSNVYVIHNTTQKRSFTGKNGHFTLKISNLEKDSLRFTCLGYSPLNISLTSYNNGMTLKMHQKIESLDEITVIKRKRNLQNKIKYKKIAKLQKGVYGFGSTIYNGLLYISGGDLSIKDNPSKKAAYLSSSVPNPSLNDFFKYLQPDYSKSEYSNKIQILNLETFNHSDVEMENRAYHNMIEYNGSLYILGGRRYSSDGKLLYMESRINVLNTKDNIMEIDETNPHQGTNVASFVYGDNIILMGGSITSIKEENISFMDRISTYDITSGYWYNLGKMPSAKEVNGTLIKNTFYTIGGYNGVKLSSIESYNLITGKWKYHKNLPYGIAKPAVTSHKEIIYFFDNGFLFFFDTVTQRLLKFELPLNLSQSNMHYYNDALWIIGGYTEQDFSKTPSPWVYKIDVNQFRKTKSKLIKN